jgi:SAM-dependent methyltransferase
VSVQDTIERAWQEMAAIDAALERDEIDEAEWHRRCQALLVPAYLSATTPQGQSGHSGDAARWRHARELVLDAVAGSGTFLDVGCANGLLMESVAAWGLERGLVLEPWGLELSPELACLARRRLPAWAERVLVGNALGWRGRGRFDYVRTGLDYVPRRRRRELVEHLLGEVVAPGGRLIVGVFNEAVEAPRLEDVVAAWGFAISGRTSRRHRDSRVEYRAFWVDSPRCGSARRS